MESVSNQRNSSGISATPVKDLFDGTVEHFSAAEVEFIAENCLVSIKPRRKMEEIDLISVKIERKGAFLLMSLLIYRENLVLSDRIKLKMFHFGWPLFFVKETIVN